LVALWLAVMLRVELSDVDGVWLGVADEVTLKLAEMVALKLAETVALKLAEMVAVTECDVERVCVGVAEDERLTS